MSAIAMQVAVRINRPQIVYQRLAERVVGIDSGYYRKDVFPTPPANKAGKKIFTNGSGGALFTPILKASSTMLACSGKVGEPP